MWRTFSRNVCWTLPTCPPLTLFSQQLISGYPASMLATSLYREYPVTASFWNSSCVVWSCALCHCPAVGGNQLQLNIHMEYGIVLPNRAIASFYQVPFNFVQNSQFITSKAQHSTASNVLLQNTWQMKDFSVLLFVLHLTFSLLPEQLKFSTKHTGATFRKYTQTSVLEIRNYYQLTACNASQARGSDVLELVSSGAPWPPISLSTRVKTWVYFLLRE